MAGNQVDIIIRAIDKNVRGTFATLNRSIKTSKLAMDAFQQTMKKTNAVAASMSGQLKTAFAGASIAVATQQLWAAGTQAQRLQLAFEAISGSSKGAKDELQYVREESERLGLVFYSTADAYKAIFAAGSAGNVPLETTRKIFSGFSESFAALGLNADQVEGSLRAVSQMMGKNKVLAEELRTQLGEKLPVAIQYFATAAGVSVGEFEKLMANGKVGIEDIAKTAELLSQDFGKKSEEAAKQAIGILAKFKTAWWGLKTIISNAGFLELATKQLIRLTDAMKDPKTVESIRSISSSFFTMTGALLEFVWVYRDWVAGFITLVVLGKTVTTLTALWTGLNVAMLAMTNLRVVAFFQTVYASMNTAAVVAAGMSGAIAGSFGVLLAYFAGWKIGRMLSDEFEIVEKTGIATAAAVHKAWVRTKGFISSIKWWDKDDYDASAVEAELKKIDDGYAEMFANVGKGAKTAKKANETVAASGKKGAKATAIATSQATKEMETAWKKYMAEVKKIQAEIVSKERSLAAQLREMGRGGMDSLGVWKDIRKEADGLYASSQKALAEAEKAFTAGNEELGNIKMKEAAELAGEARTKYAELNTEVEKNGKILVSEAKARKIAIEAVKKAGALELEILKTNQAAKQAAADKINKESGFAFEKEKLAELAVATDKYAHIVVPKIGKAYVLVWKDASQKGQAMIKEIDITTGRFLDKKREMKIKISLQKPSQAEINKIFADMPGVSATAQREGGLIGIGPIMPLMMAAGGAVRNAMAGFHFPGYGGGDKPRNLVMAENGEVMIRKEMVKASGLKAALAWNDGDFKTVLVELLKRFGHPGDIMKKQLGGLISSVRPPAVSALSTSGLVAASPAGGATYQLTQHFSSEDVSPITRRTARDNAEMVLTELQRMVSRGSK